MQYFSGTDIKVKMRIPCMHSFVSNGFVCSVRNLEMEIIAFPQWYLQYLSVQ
uniref:Uncharacterized protein n=1 Tax=Anguilla anguilla TaxID=7936 RepID=A0A0E9XZD8_ANGAN